LTNKAIDLDPAGLPLRSLTEFQGWYADSAAHIAARHQVHVALESSLPEGGSSGLPGWCAVCEKDSTFSFDWLYSAPGKVNWRERLACAGCQLNNRLRLSVDVIRQLAPLSNSALYATEQLTPFVRILRSRYPTLAASEYLGPGLKPGTMRPDGIRHEDLTQLSFSDGTFDLVASFDVLEHIPDFRKALAEMRRVLKPGGHLVLSAPMSLGVHDHHVRARLLPNGEAEHLAPPEYHGDPVHPDRGVLCYYHFGWRLIEDCREAGFRDAAIRLYWSRRLGHIGFEQSLLVASA